MAGVLLAAFLLDEKLTILQYSSSVFIIFGLLCVVWSQHKEEQIEHTNRKRQDHYEREDGSVEDLEDNINQADSETANLMEMEVISDKTNPSGEVAFVDITFSELGEEGEL